MPYSKEVFQKMQEESRQKILLAALKVFVTKSVNATVGEIAQEAGISKGLIYHYFISKNELLLALLDWGTSGSMAAVEECVKKDTAAEAITAISQMMSAALSQNDQTTQFFFLHVQLSVGGVSREVQEKLAQMRAPAGLFASLIEQAQQEGAAKEGDALTLSQLYWAAISGLCCTILSGQEVSVKPEMLSGIVLKHGKRENSL